VAFHHEGWKARVTPPRLETDIPLKVLHGLTPGARVGYEVRDTCGTSTGSFAVP
jgi:hypothetical protein